MSEGLQKALDDALLLRRKLLKAFGASLVMSALTWAFLSYHLRDPVLSWRQAVLAVDRVPGSPVLLVWMVALVVSNLWWLFALVRAGVAIYGWAITIVGLLVVMSIQTVFPAATLLLTALVLWRLTAAIRAGTP